MAVLAEPITRLVYQRGEFGAEATDLVSDGDGLVVDLAAVPGGEPAVLAHLLQPPAPVGHHRARRAQPGGERGRRRRLYGPFGIAGIVLGTVAGTVVMCVAQGWILRRELDGIEGARTGSARRCGCWWPRRCSARCATGSGRASTPRSAARSQARRCRCLPRSPPGHRFTRPRYGCCACPRRGRSAGCSLVATPRTARRLRLLKGFGNKK